MCRYIGTLCVNALIALIALIALPGGPVAAQTWTGGGGNGNWTTTANWTGGTPVSSATTALTFGGSAQLATIQDLANPFLLNTLTVQAGAGAFTIGGSELRFGGAANTLTQSAANAIGIAAPVAFDGNGTIGGAGAGSLTLNSLHVRQGALTLNRNASVGALTLGIDGGTAASLSTGTNVLTLAGDVTFVQSAGTVAAPPATLAGTINLGGANRTFTGVYSTAAVDPGVDLLINATLTGPGGFVKGGSPTEDRSWMMFTSANTYTGPTILESGSERLYLGVANAIPATSAVQVRDSSQLFLTNVADPEGTTGFSQTIGSLSDGGTVGGLVRIGQDGASAVVLTTGGDNSSTTFAGQIVGGGQLVKVGTGTLTLTNAGNTYAGGTTVRAGTLRVTGSAGAVELVTVEAAGTIDGTGTITGAVNLFGRLQGGDGLTATGNPTLTAGAVVFESGSRIRVAVGGATPATATNSRVDAGQTFIPKTTTDVLTLDLFNTGTLDLSGTQTYSITVVTFDSSDATAANFALNPVNFAFSGTPLVTLNGTSLVVQFTPVPEAGWAIGFAGAGLWIIGWIRRRSPAAGVITTEQ